MNGYRNYSNNSCPATRGASLLSAYQKATTIFVVAKFNFTAYFAAVPDLNVFKQ